MFEQTNSLQLKIYIILLAVSRYFYVVSLQKSVCKYDIMQVLQLQRPATSDPRRSEDDNKVTDLAYSEHGTAEYQAKRSTDITHQSQR